MVIFSKRNEKNKYSLNLVAVVGLSKMLNDPFSPFY